MRHCQRSYEFFQGVEKIFESFPKTFQDHPGVCFDLTLKVRGTGVGADLSLYMSVSSARIQLKTDRSSWERLN